LTAAHASWKRTRWVTSATVPICPLAQELPETDGEIREITADFKVIYLRNEAVLEFRNLWLGGRSFKLYEISANAI
jgi:hypothetical protein